MSGIQQAIWLANVRALWITCTDFMIILPYSPDASQQVDMQA